MATLAELQDALINADKAGDAKAAKILADEIVKLRAQPTLVPQPTPQPDLTPAQKLTDIARSGAKGATKGLIGLAALPSMAQEGIASLMESMGATRPTYGLRTMPTYEQLTGLVEQIPGAETVTQYQPQTIPGEYAETISEFTAPGGVFAKTARGLGQAAIIGTGAGAVQETAEQFDAPVWAQVPLTLTTALALGYATAPSRASKIANEALKGVDDAELAIAMQMEEGLKAKGYTITAPELIDNKIVQRLGVDIYGTEKGGQIMYTYLKERPEQLKNISENLLDEISKKPEYLRGVFKQTGTTAKKAQTEAKKERRIKAQQEGYIISNKEFVKDDGVLKIINRIDEEIKNLPKGSPVISKLNSLKQRITKREAEVEQPVTILDQSGRPLTQPIPRKKIVPETNINKLDQGLKEFRQMVDDSYAQPALSPERYLDKAARTIMSNESKTGILDELDVLLRTNPSYSNAKNTFARLSDNLVKPIEDNLEDLLKGGVTSSKVKSFIFNPEKNNVNDIKKTYQILNKTDKNTFPQLARTYIENATNNAFVLREGGESAKAGFNLYKALAGTKAKEANLNQVLKGVAEANGVNPNSLLLGWNNFNEVLKRTGRLVNIDSPGAPIDPRFLPRDIAQIGSFMWRIKFAGKLDEVLQERSIKQLANIFTKENSVEELIKLGKTGVDTNDAIRRVAYIVSLSEPIRQDQPIEQAVPQ